MSYSSFVAVLLSAVFTVIAVPLRADVRRTEEGNAIHQLVLGMRAFAEDHKGQAPSDWDQLREYAPLDALSRSLPQRLDAIYAFVTNGPSMREPEEGQIVLLRTSTLVEASHNKTGRYVVWQSSDGSISDKWVSENEVQRLLGSPSEKASSVADTRQRITITVQITNPDATLIAGEPLCLKVDVNALDAEVPDRPTLIIDMEGPTGKRSFELSRLHFLEPSQRQAQMDLSRTNSGTFSGSFQLALLLDMDIKEDWSRLSTPRVLTSTPGGYMIKVREASSGGESALASFKVIAAASEDAAAASLFTSKSALGALYGITTDLSSLTRILEESPNSRFAQYSSLAIGLAHFRELEKAANALDSTQTSEGPRASLAKYFEKTTQLGFPSLFDLKAMYYRALCLMEANKTDEAKSLLTSIGTKYGNTLGVEETQNASRVLAQIVASP